MGLLTVAEGTEYEVVWRDVRGLFPWAQRSGSERPSPQAEIYLHHTAVPYVGDDEITEVLYLVRIAQTGLYGLPYNLVVFPAAPYRTWYLNDVDENYPHTYRHNDDVALCVAGNFEHEQVTDGLVETLRVNVGALRNLWPEREIPVLGHRDVFATACPGGNLYAHLGTING